MKISRCSQPTDSLVTRLLVNNHQAILLLVVVLFGRTMSAATFTWDGGGANDNWSTGLNWAGDTPPATTSSANDFVFAGATRLTPQMETDYAVQGISFSSGASAFTIQSTAGGAQTLTLGSGGVANNSANAQALNVDAITLAAIQSWNAAAGNLSSSSAIALGGFTLTIDGANNTALGGNVTGAGGLTKVGTGTLTLSGGNSSYTGVTTINNGVVNIRDNSSLGGTGAGNGTTVASGAALELQGATITYDSEAVTLNGTGISDGGALRNISGANTWTGAITLGAASRINSDAGLILSGGITGTGLGLTMGGSGVTTLSTAGINTSTGGTLTKDGSGTLTITVAGSYTGTTTIGAGVVNIQNATALGTPTGGAVSVTGGAALQLQGGITVASPKALTLNGTGISADGALRNISGNNNWAGTITLGSATRINSEANNLTLSGGIAGDGNALTSGGAGDVTISSAMGGIGTTLTKDGTGALVLSGTSPNTYSGVTTVNEGFLFLSKTAGINAIAGNLTSGDGSATATVQLTAANQIADTSVVTINTGGVFDLNTLAETIGSLSGSGSVTLGAGGALTVGDASSTTYSGAISQAGSVTKAGSGALTFSGGSANTYSGTTTVNEGTLILNKTPAVNAIGGALSIGDGTGTDTVQLGANDQIPTVAVTVNSSGVLDLATFTDTIGALTINGGSVATGNGSLTITTLGMTAGSVATGAGTLTLGGTVTGTGAAASATISGKVALGSTRIFSIANGAAADDMSISAIISGGGFGITKTGAGRLTLSGDNTFTGIVSVGVGTLRAITSANALGTGAATLDLGGGTLELADNIGLNFARNTTVSSSSTIHSDRVTAGAGVTQTLGTLSIGAQTLSVAVGGNVTPDTAYGLTFGATTTSANGAVFDVANNGTGVGTLTLGVLSGDDDWTKQGNGTLVLNSASVNATTAVTLTAGTLKLGSPTGIGTVASAAFLLNGGTLDLATDSSVSAYVTTANGTVTIASDRATSGAGITHTLGTLSIGTGDQLNVTVGANVVSGTAGLTFGATTLSAATPIFNVAGGANLTLGALSGNFAFTKQGTGQLTLNTASGRTSGNVTNAGGTMKLGIANALGTTGVPLGLIGGTLDLATDTTVNAYNTFVDGTVTIASDRASSGPGINHTLGQLGIGTGDTLNVVVGANVASGTAGLTFGATTLSASTPIFNVAGGANLTLGALSGNFAFTKQGAGELVLNSAANANRTTAVVTNAAGRMKLGSTSALGTAGVSLFFTGGTLDLATDTSVNAHNTLVGGDVSIESDRATLGEGITHTLGALGIGANTLTLDRGANVTSNIAALSFSAATLTGNAIFNPSSGTLLTLASVGGAGRSFTAQGAGDTTVSGPITTGSGDITKSGAGVLTLSGNNTFTGGLTVNNGTVIVNNAGALNTTTPNAVTMNGGILRLNGNSVTISSLSGSSGMVNNTAAGNLTLTVNQAGNTAFGGVLANGGAGTLALQKTGAGTLTLSGANTYTGGTTLSAGHLALSSDNVLPNTGTFTFAGGILDANSHTDLIGPLSLTASSTLNLSPGGASGTLTFASMTASAATVWTINGWSGVANTTGTADHVILSANPGATVLGQIHFAGYADGALYLLGGEIVPVPEPSNIALGIFGAVVALFGIRQRLRSQARRPA